MIIYHQRNLAAFAGNHVYYWLPNQIVEARHSITSAAAAVSLIAQSRASGRFVFSRVFGRVN